MKRLKEFNGKNPGGIFAILMAGSIACETVVWIMKGMIAGGAVVAAGMVVCLWKMLKQKSIRNFWLVLYLALALVLVTLKNPLSIVNGTLVICWMVTPLIMKANMNISKEKEKEE